MKKTLLILAHPHLQKSIRNKLIAEELANENKLEIRDLTALYPNYNINVAEEQKKLVEADTIVFQYPLYWYNVPPILKLWIDEVFTYGFAFGKGNYQLEGKKIVVSCTIGSNEDIYPAETLEKIFFHFKGLAAYCKMDYFAEVISFGEVHVTGEPKSGLENSAKKHAEKLRHLLRSVT
ncbi:MAG: flavodoxin [Bacteroidetes bacterium HGW-Bacteroidetes-12]|nr:MAG: flavodoxin [Bacteroidetes bacterium HGW-Bacteroidetes-12]